MLLKRDHDQAWAAIRAILSGAAFGGLMLAMLYFGLEIWAVW